MARFTLRKHKKYVQLWKEMQEAVDADDIPKAEALNVTFKKLPMYHGKTESPEGEAMSTAVFVNDDETITISHRPWADPSDPIKK